MAADCWAHVRVDDATAEVAPHALEDHLGEVARLAAGFAAGSMCDWARLAGRWHDLGKAIWQARPEDPIAPPLFERYFERLMRKLRRCTVTIYGHQVQALARSDDIARCPSVRACRHQKEGK